MVATAALDPDLTPATAGLRDAGVSPVTARVYRRELQRLDAWLAGRELDDGILGAYVAVRCARTGAGPADKLIGAVRWRALIDRVDAPVGPFTLAAVREVRRGGRGRKRGAVDGISWGDADTLAAAAEASGGLAGLRDAAIFAVMSDGALRAAEASGLDVADVAELAGGVGETRIRRSKTDQEGRGDKRYAGEPTVRRVRAWREAAGLAGSGPLFRPVTAAGAVLASRLTTDAIRTLIREAARAAGMKGRFGGHSFRVGAVESAVQRGAGLPEVQQMGGWTDPRMPGHYAKGAALPLSVVPRLRYGRDTEPDRLARRVFARRHGLNLVDRGDTP